MIRIRERTCPELCNDGQKTFLIPKDPSNKDLDTAIEEVLLFVKNYLHIDFALSISTERDSALIRKSMKMYLVNNSIKKTNPEILSEWDYDKNDELGLYPHGLTSGASSVQVWWKCSNNHSYKKSPNEKIRLGKGCPYCAGKIVLTPRTATA